MRPTQSECAKGADSIAKGKSRKTALQREAQLDATVLEGNFQKHGQVNLSDAFSHFGYPIQRKMSIGDSNDAYEREADAVADHVMRMPISGTEPKGISNISPKSIQRKCAACEEEQIQRKPLPISQMIQSKSETGKTPAVDGKTSQAIERTRGGGSQLDQATKGFMESRFGHDFSDVRVHTSGYAQELSSNLNARAFAVGNDIYFNQGQYQPHTESGKHLLAHELTHTVQQVNGIGERVQKVGFGGAQGEPADWAAQVTAATTSAQKAALVQTAVGSSVTVVDKTAASATDTSPDPAHLLSFTATSAQVNYDEGLNSKTSRTGRGILSRNAGYTFFTGGTNYVVLGPLVLNGNDYYGTVRTLNHEFDHVRQNIAGSTLTGNSSELDAWTSTFIRDFHRSYLIQESSPGNCFVQSTSTFTPLQGYYAASSVSASERTAALTRIQQYYNSVIAPHEAHLAVFKYWLRRQLGNASHQMVSDLITLLGLSITTAATLGSFRQFPCGTIMTLPAIASPSALLPTFPTPTPPPSGPPARP